MHQGAADLEGERWRAGRLDQSGEREVPRPWCLRGSLVLLIRLGYGSNYWALRSRMTDECDSCGRASQGFDVGPDLLFCLHQSAERVSAVMNPANHATEVRSAVESSTSGYAGGMSGEALNVLAGRGVDDDHRVLRPCRVRDHLVVDVGGVHSYGLPLSVPGRGIHNDAGLRADRHRFIGQAVGTSRLLTSASLPSSGGPTEHRAFATSPCGETLRRG